MNIIAIDELINQKSDLKLLCSLSDSSIPLSECLKDDVHSIIFAIGPEGGFTPQEESLLINNGYQGISLGKRVMRVETAAIYVASIINYVYKG